jgi:hypothetical protein
MAGLSQTSRFQVRNARLQRGYTSLGFRIVNREQASGCFDPTILPQDSCQGVALMQTGDGIVPGFAPQFVVGGSQQAPKQRDVIILHCETGEYDIWDSCTGLR